MFKTNCINTFLTTIKFVRAQKSVLVHCPQAPRGCGLALWAFRL